MKPFRPLRLLILILVIFMTGCSGSAATPAPIVPTPTLIPISVPTPAPTSSPTPLPSPTTLLEPKLYTVDIAQLENVPQDLMQLLFSYGGGAGIGGGSMPDQQPPLLGGYAGAVVPAIPMSLSWSVTTYFDSPHAEASLTLPDGSKVPVNLEWNPYSERNYTITYPIVPGALLGTYTLELIQDSFMLQDSLDLEFPSKPIWTTYQGNNWYAGFKPGEQVTLHICEELYFSWLNGVSLAELTNLAQQVPGSNGSVTSVCGKTYTESIIADGYGSFQVHVPDGYWVDVQADESGVNTTVPSCGELDPTQLELGGLAQTRRGVTQNSDTKNPAFSRDGTEVSLKAGTQVTPVMGPICNPYLSRWEWIVQTSDQTLFWMFETYANGSILEPVKP
jgi:hypothetical protein